MTILTILALIILIPISLIVGVLDVFMIRCMKEDFMGFLFGRIPLGIVSTLFNITATYLIVYTWFNLF